MDGYLFNRQKNHNVSGSKRMITATDDQTLIAAPGALETIYIQKLHIEITTASATTWSFIDNASVPITRAVDVSTIGHVDIDFGPEGVPLTQANSFVLNVGATGAAGWITWEAYRKRTAVGN